jgi:hypothetical protein
MICLLLTLKLSAMSKVAGITKRLQYELKIVVMSTRVGADLVF